MNKKLVISFLLFVAIGVFGLLVLQITKENETTYNPETNNNQKISQLTYLTINEWRVKFPLPDESAGQISYRVKDSNEIETIELISSNTNLSECAPLSITRSKKEGFGEILINGFYYEILAAPGACETSDSPRQIKALNIQKLLQEAAMNLVSL